MEFINANDIKELSNPGVISRQLLNSENSASRRVTITEVHLVAGASQPRQSISATPTRRKVVKDFFTRNYDHPIFEAGVQLVDMIYLQKPLAQKNIFGHNKKVLETVSSEV